LSGSRRPASIAFIGLLGAIAYEDFVRNEGLTPVRTPGSARCSESIGRDRRTALQARVKDASEHDAG
jgi:hypothetical protein